MNQLLKKLTELEFCAVDLGLYIDTHPDNKEAIAMYNKTAREASAVRAEYEKMYGPLYSYVSMSDPEKSNWTTEIWPWETKFYKEDY